MLATALRAGRLGSPYTSLSVQRVLGDSVASEVAAELQELHDSGMSASGVAQGLDLVAGSVALRPRVDDVIDLVTTGPEVGGVTNRDTVVVVRELFAKAEQSILVAGYAVHQGQKIFRALADRMAERSDLRVRLFLDIQRRAGDTSASSELLMRFAHRFRTAQWPIGSPMPDVFYDPRSLDAAPGKPVALHAKCIVVDNQHVFVSSANLTEAAQQRNIEVGLLVHSPLVAERLQRFFQSLIGAGQLKQVPGIEA